MTSSPLNITTTKMKTCLLGVMSYENLCQGLTWWLLCWLLGEEARIVEEVKSGSSRIYVNTVLGNNIGKVKSMRTSRYLSDR